MAHGSSKQQVLLQPSGQSFSISPANSDVSVHVDEKAVRLATLGFSNPADVELNTSSCLFMGTASSCRGATVLDVHADRYDPGLVNRGDEIGSVFPKPSVCLGQDDVAIPCFLNRRVSKAELRLLSNAMLFPSMEERGFAPSLRDIFACCISLRLSATSNFPRSLSASVVTRADLRISLPTNTAVFTPVDLPAQLFGGIDVADLLPPVISTHSSQTFRAGYISLRSASNRLASSIGFLLETDVGKTQAADSSLIGIWVSGCNTSPAEDLRIYAACMRYTFDVQLAKRRLLPLMLTNHRAPPQLPFSSTQNAPYFLVAVVSHGPRLNPKVTFFECRMSPALNPTYAVLTATALLPPPMQQRQQQLKLDFVLGRAASVAVCDRISQENLDDSAEDNFVAENDDALLHSQTASISSSLRRLPPQPQPQPQSTYAQPSVPDVSLWLPATSANMKAQDVKEAIAVKQIDTLSTPRISSESRIQVPHLDHRFQGSKSAANSVSSFEDEWRQLREKVELMWQKTAPQKLVTNSQTASIDASVLTSPPHVLRASFLSDNTKVTDVSDGNESARTLRDACVGVGTSLLMLASPKASIPATISRQNLNSAATAKVFVEQTPLPSKNIDNAPKPIVPAVALPVSNSCSQCCSREDLASVASKTDTGCCLFPRRQKHSASEVNFSLREKAKKHEPESIAVDKDVQSDPCSLILKWLQRCGNDNSTSSICRDGPNDNRSQCSSEGAAAVKTAAAICTYLNGDSALMKERFGADDEENTHFASLSTTSSRSLILKSRTCEEEGNKQSYGDSQSSSWTNCVHSSIASHKPVENGDSFAARAREIVRQMDEWGLAPNQARRNDGCVDTYCGNDTSGNSNFDQHANMECNRLCDVSMASESVASVSARTSSNKVAYSQRMAGEENTSFALPRVVALESLRLGPTNTTLVMKTLASKHLTSPHSQPSVMEDNSIYQKPPKAASATCLGGNRR